VCVDIHNVELSAALKTGGIVPTYCVLGSVTITLNAWQLLAVPYVAQCSVGSTQSLCWGASISKPFAMKYANWQNNSKWLIRIQFCHCRHPQCKGCDVQSGEVGGGSKFLPVLCRRPLWLSCCRDDWQFYCIELLLQTAVYVCSTSQCSL